MDLRVVIPCTALPVLRYKEFFFCGKSIKNSCSLCRIHDHSKLGLTMLNLTLFLCLFVALTVGGDASVAEDGVVMDEAAAAMLRRLAEKVPLLALNRTKRAFVDVRYANWMKDLPENVLNMPLSGTVWTASQKLDLSADPTSNPSHWPNRIINKTPV